MEKIILLPIKTVSDLVYGTKKVAEKAFKLKCSNVFTETSANAGSFDFIYNNNPYTLSISFGIRKECTFYINKNTNDEKDLVPIFEYNLERAEEYILGTLEKMLNDLNNI